MTDILIIAVVVVVLFIAVRSTVKKAKNKSSCCSGPAYKAKVKKLNSVAAKTVLQVDGMSCQHCVNRVMEVINDMDGASAVVNLKKGTVTVSMEQKIDSSILKAAIEKAGYTVTGITE